MQVIPPGSENKKVKKPAEVKSISLSAQSPELIQALYHEITNKTEKITDYFEDNLEISYDNLCELNRFVEQTFKPHETKEPSTRVRVSFDGGENLQFSSFARFSIAQSTTTKTIKNLNIKYSFLVSTATQQQTANIENKYSAYEVEITILPSIYKNSDFKGMPSGLKKFVIDTRPTLVSEITYVDFAVARSFQAAIKSWVETVKVPKRSSFSRNLSEHSSYYFRLLKFIGILLGFFVIYSIIPKFDGAVSEIFRQFSLWVMISFGLILFISSAVKLFEKLHDIFIAPIHKYCVLKITSGDKENADKIIAAYKIIPKKIAFMIIGALGGIGLNLIAAIISSKFLS